MPKPVRVKNPTDNHIVHVHPNQEIIVTISGEETLDVDGVSDYFRLVDEQKRADGNFVYRFAQTEDLSPFAKVYSVHLGQIIICSDSWCSEISVILHSSNAAKRDVVSIPSPLAADLKIDPHQIIHVALQHFSPFEWHDPQVAGGRFGNCLELLGRQKVRGPSSRVIDDIYHSIPYYPESNETHFWFRCNPVNLSAAGFSNVPNGLYETGKLVFTHPYGAQMYSLNVTLNVRDRTRKKFYLTALCPKFNTKAFAHMVSSRPIRPPKKFRSSYIPYRQKVILRRKAESDIQTGCNVVHLHKIV